MSYTDMSHTEMSYTEMSYIDMSYVDRSYTYMSYTDTSHTDIRMLETKAVGPPKGVVARLFARTSVGSTRVLNRALAAVRCVSAACEVSSPRAS